jgi:DNA-binding transcriptional LysR family regulator
LEALVAVAREASFRRAADTLGYVQSAVSGQISRLEELVGVRLVERGSGNVLVRLTAEGRVLVEHAEEILVRLESAYADVGSLNDRAAGAVRVAGLDLLSVRRIAEVVRGFRGSFPGARVVFAGSGPTGAGEDGCDVLIFEVGPAAAPIGHAVVERDPYALVVERGSELVGRGWLVGASELAALRPMVPESCVGSNELASQLASLGIARDPCASPESVRTAQALVAAGVGSAIVPSGLVEDRGTTVAIDLSHLLTPRTIAVAASGRPSPLADGFVRAVRAVCARESSAQARR